MAAAMVDLGWPPATQRFAIYGVALGDDPVLLEDAETLDSALAWVQTYRRDVRRMYTPTLRRGTPAYGEVIDWLQGSTVLCWRIG